MNTDPSVKAKGGPPIELLGIPADNNDIAYMRMAAEELNLSAGEAKYNVVVPAGSGVIPSGRKLQPGLYMVKVIGAYSPDNSADITEFTERLREIDEDLGGFENEMFQFYD